MIDHRWVQRWISLFDHPLASTNSRVQADRLLAETLGDSPTWASVWAAGSLHSVVQTLPGDDPWKRISSAIQLSDGSVAVRQIAGEPALITTDAYLGGVQFGAVSDGTDIYDHPMVDPWLDPALAILTGPVNPNDLPPRDASEVPPLGRAAAALLGFAGGELPPLIDAVGAVLEAADPTEATAEITDAFRWAAWRRGCYAGPTDNFPATSMMSWRMQADIFMVGEWTPNRHESDIADNAIPDGSWTSWRNYLNDVRSKPTPAPGSIFDSD